MRKILLLCTFLAFGPWATAQSSLDPAWSFGLTAAFSTNQHQVGAYMDQYKIRSNRNSPNQMRFGVYTQALFPGVSIRPELTYSTTSFIMQVQNLAVSQGDWKAFVAQEDYRKLELYLPVGLSIRDNMTVEIGPVAGRRVFQGPSDTQIRRISGASRPEHELLHDIGSSFHAWSFDWRAGVQFFGGPLHFGVAYQSNITPLGSHINHNGHRYQMRQQCSQLIVNAGLQLFRR